MTKRQMPFKSHSQNSISSSWEDSESFKVITCERFIHLLGILQLLNVAESNIISIFDPKMTLFGLFLSYFDHSRSLEVNFYIFKW